MARIDAMTQFKYWNLLRELTRAQIKLKDQSTFFGFLWSLLNPLLLVLVLFLIFQSRLAEDVEYYPLYLLIGVIHYTHFAHSSGAAMHVLHSMRQLTAEAVFPKEIMVVGSVLANSLDFVLEIGIIILIAMFARLPLTLALVWLPVVMLLQVMFVLWVSLLLACLYVFVRDIEHLYGVFLRLLLFLTPIFYAPTFLGPTAARWMVRVNPLATFMEFSRGIVLNGVPPPLPILGLILAANLAALAVAWLVFKRFEPRFAEHV